MSNDDVIRCHLPFLLGRSLWWQLPSQEARRVTRAQESNTDSSAFPLEWRHHESVWRHRFHWVVTYRGCEFLWATQSSLDDSCLIQIGKIFQAAHLHIGHLRLTTNNDVTLSHDDVIIPQSQVASGADPSLAIRRSYSLQRLRREQADRAKRNAPTFATELEAEVQVLTTHSLPN